MIRNVLMFLFLFTASKLVASDIQWFEGALVLNNKTVLCGKISVEEKYDMVLFQSGDKVDVYPAHSLESVHYYDASAKINRKFLVIGQRAPMKRSQLFEVVLAGTMSIVRHVKDISIRPYADADDYFYFTRTESGLIPLEKFRGKVYEQLLRDGGLSLSVFVSENHLDPNVSAHAIMIVEEFNRLKKTEQAIARH